MLVRSTATNWTKGSVLAVDGGTHLAAIIRVLDEHLPYAKRGSQSESAATPDQPSRSQPSLSGNGGQSPAISPYTSQSSDYITDLPDARGTRAGSPAPVNPTKAKPVLTSGPFANLTVPFETARANAAYIIRDLISTWVVTHPHLDHLAGFAINTASFTHTNRVKRLAALPSTIDAIRTHIFNDIIWPDLSDEDGGAGLVSYMRLVDGGNVALGNGEGRGYIEVVDGLTVKSWSVSHGNCMKGHGHRGSTTLNSQEPFMQHPSSRRGSRVATSPSSCRSHHGSQNNIETEDGCVYDSSAFFIRDDETGRELLVFGDVEPDAISTYPRTARVWADAASKIASGLLTGIFIECSYDDSQEDHLLFGHLAPRHLVAELQVLAEKVKLARKAHADEALGRRKKHSNGVGRHDPDIWKLRGRDLQQTRRRATDSSSVTPSRMSEDPIVGELATLSLTTGRSLDVSMRLDSNEGPHCVSPSKHSRHSSLDQKPLQGLQIIIIHIKDTLRDGPPVSETILAQLQEHEEAAGLGCHFVISKSGESFWL